MNDLEIQFNFFFFKKHISDPAMRSLPSMRVIRSTPSYTNGTGGYLILCHSNFWLGFDLQKIQFFFFVNFKATILFQQVKIMDCFLFEGQKVLFRIGLAIVQQFSKSK